MNSKHNFESDDDEPIIAKPLRRKASTLEKGSRLQHKENHAKEFQENYNPNYDHDPTQEVDAEYGYGQDNYRYEEGDEHVVEKPMEEMADPEPGVERAFEGAKDFPQDDPKMTFFSFYNVLNLLSGVDDIVQPAAEYFQFLNEHLDEDDTSVKQIITNKLSEIKAEEKDILEHISAKEYALQSLRSELKKLENSVDTLRQKKRTIHIQIKCIEASYQYLTDHLQSVHLYHINNEEPIQEHENNVDVPRTHDNQFDSFIWFIKNTLHHPDQQQSQLRQAFDGFFKFSLTLSDRELEVEHEKCCLIAELLIQELESALPPLKALMFAVLSDLSREAHVADICFHEGTLYDQFIVALQSINTDLMREATNCILGLVQYVEYKEKIGDAVLAPLIELLWRQQDVVVAEKALIAIWHLAMIDRFKELIREFGGLEIVCSKLSSEHEEILENTTIALGYLTRNDDNKEVMRDIDGLKALIDILNNESESIQAKAAGALWNCASNSKNKIAIRKLGGIQTLISLLSSESETVLENVTGALWNCAVNDENKREIYSANGIERLVELLYIDHDAIVENASGTIWNCATVPDIKVTLRECNGLKPLIQLLYSENVHIQENAAGAIRNCAINDANKVHLRELGAMEVFVSLLDPTNTKLSILEKVTSSLWICSIDQQNKLILKSYGAFPKLIMLLEHPSRSVVEKSLGTLRNCSTISENKIAIRDAGGIAHFIHLLDSAYQPSIREYAAATLWNLGRDDENKSIIRKYGGIEGLVAVLDSTEEAVQENAAGALLTLSLDEENRVKVREAGGLPLLIDLLHSKNDYVVENAIGALKNCAANDKNIVLLGSKLNIIPILVMLMRTNKNGNIMRECALCFKNLSMNEQNTLTIGKEKGIDMLFSLIHSTKNDSLRKVAAYTIQALAKHPANMKIVERLKRSIASRKHK